MTTATTLARGLGVLSLGLGAASLLDTRRFVTGIGLRPSEGRINVTRLVGVRELGAAAGLLASRRPVTWQWARVAGDVMDIGLLSLAFAQRDADRRRVGAALGSVLAITVVDAAAAMLVTGESGPRGTAITTDRGTRRIRLAVTVNVARQDAYAAWHDFERLPAFMHHLQDVVVIDATRSHWRAKAPAGRTVEWDAEITEDVPGEVIAWRSTGGSPLTNWGRVRFADAPGDRGTEVHVELEYAPPLGPLGALVARLSGEEPARQVADDLRRFKQMLETGRVAESEATFGDRTFRQRPAQPPEPDTTREPVAAKA